MPNAKSITIADVIDERPISWLQYRIFFLCAFITLMDGFDTQAIGYVAPLLASAINTPMTAFGLAFSAGLAGAALGAFLFGPLADRFGRRRPLIVACMLFAIFSVATAFVASFNQLLLVRFAAGIGLGGAVPTCLATIAEFAPKRIRSLAITAMWSSFAIGGFIGGLVSSYFISTYGWQSVFFVGGILPLVAGFLLLFQMPESLGYLSALGSNQAAIRDIVARIAPDFRSADLSLLHTEETAHRGPVRDIFSDGRAWATLLLWVPFFLGFMVILSVVLWGPSLLNTSGVPLSVSALIFAAHYLGGFVGTAWSGHLVDRFAGPKVLVLGFLLGAACLASFGALTSYPVLLGVDAFLCGLFVVGATNGMVAIASMLYPTPSRATGIGWAMGVGRFGQLVGPIAVGMMLSAHLSLPSIFFWAGIACVVSAVFLVLLAVSSLRRSAPVPSAGDLGSIQKGDVPSIQKGDVPMPTMIAARVHKYGEPMKLDQIPIPQPRSSDVLVEVKACGIVPNLARVVSNFFGTQTPDLKTMPPLPAIFGLDPVGVITEVGDQVRSVRPGDRVYVNPARKCGSCHMCRSGRPLDCPDFTFQGYFGRSQEIMKAYPYGGLCQFITAPESALVKLPDNVSFEAAARFGYLGTAYAAMRTLNVGPGQTVLINGISGMLGLNAAMLALAMGATTILGTGRNKALLERVKALSPQRIQVHAVSDGAPVGPTDPFVAWAKSITDGYGVDSSLDCLPPGASATAFMRPLFALRRGGRAANVGAVMETLPLNAFWLMTNRIGLQGSVWFTTGEGQDLAAMAATGTLDLSPLEHRIFPLSQVNEAMAALGDRNGGFTNFVIDPTRAGWPHAAVGRDCRASPGGGAAGSAAQEELSVPTPPS